MNRFLVYFTKNHGATVQLSPQVVLVGAGSVVTLLALCFLVLGYWIGYGQRVVVQDQEYRTLHETEIHAALKAVQDAKSQLEHYQATTSGDLNAITRRLGQFQANINRINALGERLTQVAGIDDAEFAFNAEPAIGGPASASEDDGMVLAGISQEVDILLKGLQSKEQQLMLLEELILNDSIAENATLSGRPIKSGWISSFYGMRVHPFTGKKEMHKGVDLAGKENSEIVAVASGVVTYSGDRWAYGNMVEIDHGNGYVTRYAHTNKNLVAVGDRVAKGQSIALMGSTGRSTGPHVHFEVIKDGRHVNPVKYLARR